jgi:hypothetical protein
MKKEIPGLLALLTVSSLLLGGCVTHEQAVVSPSGEVVVVREAPPAPRQEVIGVAPSTAHVWVNGYWGYRHGKYVWVTGHWESRPRAGATYIAGHWDHTSRGWVYTPGYWM